MSEPSSPSVNTIPVDAVTVPADPWEIQEGESSKAFEAFQVYLSLAASERSVLAAYNADRQRSGNKPAKQTGGQWTYWSTLFHWQDRARAYDDYMVGIERQEREKQRRLDAKAREQEHLKKLGDFREQLHRLNAAATEASILLLQKAIHRLNEATDEEIMKMPLGSVAQMLRAASATAATAVDSQAQALAVDEILAGMDDDGPEDSEEEG